MPDITPDPIMRIALGFMAAKHLFTASAIELFEHLAGGPATLDELAARCGIPRRTLGISADAVASLGLIERDGERYRNSAAAGAFLAGAAGPDLRPMLRFFDHISYGLWTNLEAAVRAGEGARQFDGFSDEQQQIFSAGVEAFTAGAAAALAANYDFSRHHRVLDVGGGTGSFLIPILQRHPALQGTLFELPGACAVAPAPRRGAGGGAGRNRRGRSVQQRAAGRARRDDRRQHHACPVGSANLDLLKHLRAHAAGGGTVVAGRSVDGFGA